MFVERGFVFTHETVRTWEATFATLLTYRALDHAGNLLDVRLSETRDLATAGAFFRSVRTLCLRGPRCVTADRHGAYPGAIRLEFGPTVTHCTTRYANNRLEQDHRAIQQRIRPLQQFKCFVSAARFCSAQNEVHHFLRLPPRGRRPIPLRWQRRLRHQQFIMLRRMMLAA
jgi:transposase-like protein